MLSDNNNYMPIIDEIELKIKHLNQIKPSVFSLLMPGDDHPGWRRRMGSCLSFINKRWVFPENVSGATALYLSAKPEKNLEPLLERLESVMSFRKDLLGSALLAASFYSMEELHMRLPRMEETLVNPFSQLGENITELISDTIITADGGPAEGAKAIQLYMYLTDLIKDNMMSDPADPEFIRMVGLMAVMSSRAKEMAETLCRMMKDMKTEAGSSYIAASGNDCFIAACINWISQTAGSREKRNHLNVTARNLLTGMPQELAAICMVSAFNNVFIIGKVEFDK